MFEQTLNETGITNEIYLYSGVGHAFANPSGDNYAPEETVDAWEKTLASLKKYVKWEVRLIVTDLSLNYSYTQETKLLQC